MPAGLARRRRNLLPCPGVLRMLRAVGVRALGILLILLLGAACEGEGSEASATVPAQPSASTPDREAKTPKPVSRGRDERPLPAFEGVTLTGERVSSSSLIGRRLILFFLVVLVFRTA